MNAPRKGGQDGQRGGINRDIPRLITPPCHGGGTPLGSDNGYLTCKISVNKNGTRSLRVLRTLYERAQDERGFRVATMPVGPKGSANARGVARVGQ